MKPTGKSLKRLPDATANMSCWQKGKSSHVPASTPIWKPVLLKLRSQNCVCSQRHRHRRSPFRMKPRPMKNCVWSIDISIYAVLRCKEIWLCGTKSHRLPENIIMQTISSKLKPRWWWNPPQKGREIIWSRPVCTTENSMPSRNHRKSTSSCWWLLVWIAISRLQDVSVMRICVQTVSRNLPKSTWKCHL